MQRKRDGEGERRMEKASLLLSAPLSLRRSLSLSLRLSVAAVALWPTQLDSPLATGLQRFACGLAGGLVICAFACGHGSRPVVVIRIGGSLRFERRVLLKLFHCDLEIGRAHV